MTTELTYLAWTAVLCILLWVPYIAAGASQHGFLTPADYRVPGSRVLPEWANRAQRAHLNLIENLPSFAALVLIAHLTGTSTETTARFSSCQSAASGHVVSTLHEPESPNPALALPMTPYGL